MLPDYYNILGVDKDADDKTIKAAYRKLAFTYHPDKNPDQADFKHEFLQISEAYQVLSDPYKRRDYDLKLNYRYYFDTYADKEEKTSTTSRARRPPPPDAFRNPTGKKEYSRRTYFLAYGAVLLIILIAIILPVSLNILSSETNYADGMKAYEGGEYKRAVDYFNYAITDIGTKKVEASLMIGKIMVYEFDNYAYALSKINTALETYDVSPDSLKYELFFLKAICLQQRGFIPQAKESYAQIMPSNAHYDSAQLNLGIIYSIIDQHYSKALTVLEPLTVKNKYANVAKYYKAYCLQKQHHHAEAVNLYTDLYKNGYEIGPVLYHRALSNIKLSNQNAACTDLARAIDMNVAEAVKLFESYCKPDAIND